MLTSWILALLLLLSNAYAEAISQRTMDIGFFGNYSSNRSLIFNYLKLNSQAFHLIGMIFKNSQGQQVLLPQQIDKVQAQLFQGDYNTPKTIMIEFSLRESKYSGYKWTSNNTTFQVKQLLKGQQIEDPYICTEVEIHLYHSFSAASESSLYAISNNPSDLRCSFEILTEELQYHVPSSIGISFFILQIFVVSVQLISSYLIRRWNNNQELSLSRFSMVAFSACFVATSYRIYQQVFYVTSDKKSYAIALLIITAILLIYMFIILKKMVSLRYYDSSKSRQMYYIFLIVLFFGYNYLYMNFPTELWSTLLLPIIFFVFQSHRNYKLKGTVSKVYYSYYLGIFGVQMIEPLYMFGCPKNIYLLKPQVWKSLVWAGVFFGGSIIFAIQFKFFFKSARVQRPTYRLSAPVPQPPQPSEQTEYVTHALVIAYNPNVSNQRQPPPNYSQMGQEMQIPECSICLAEVTEDVQPTYNVINTSLATDLNPLNTHRSIAVRTGCSHFFHQSCIQAWMKHRKDCPNCRKSITDMQQIVF